MGGTHTAIDDLGDRMREAGSEFGEGAAESLKPVIDTINETKGAAEAPTEEPSPEGPSEKTVESEDKETPEHLAEEPSPDSTDRPQEVIIANGMSAANPEDVEVNVNETVEPVETEEAPKGPQVTPVVSQVSQEPETVQPQVEAAEKTEAAAESLTEASEKLEGSVEGKAEASTPPETKPKTEQTPQSGLVKATLAATSEGFTGLGQSI